MEEFDPRNTVRQWTPGTTVAEGDFLFVEENGRRLHYLITTQWPTQTPGGHGWTLVSNFYELQGIKTWNPAVHYAGNDFLGTHVKYNGQVFRLRSSWSPIGASPSDAQDFWDRILLWSETQQPVEWTPGSHPRGRIVHHTVNDTRVYRGTINENGSWAAITDDSRFQVINAWNSNTTYRLLNINGWNDVSRIYFAYTIENNIRTFWRTTRDNVQGIDPLNDQTGAWQQVEFVNQETSIVTQLANGDFQLWNSRNPNVAPSVMPSLDDVNNPWELQVGSVDATFVYTEINGTITLWERSTSSSSTQQAPGQVAENSDWTIRFFSTGLRFTYTINSVGLYSFWESINPSSSNSTPGYYNGLYWRRINGTDLTDYTNYRFVFIEEEDGSIVYLATARHPNFSYWQRLSNAWIGNTGVMRFGNVGIGVYFPDDEYENGLVGMVNHWSPNNMYLPGDIVVYGISATNTFRYFVLRQGVNPAHAVGHPPMSGSSISYFWEPINVLKDGYGRSIDGLTVNTNNNTSSTYDYFNKSDLIDLTQLKRNYWIRSKDENFITN